MNEKEHFLITDMSELLLYLCIYYHIFKMLTREKWIISGKLEINNFFKLILQ